MINRQQLNTTTIQFEDFITTSRKPFIGQHHEVPMNAFGSVVARYKTIKIDQVDQMFIIVAELVA